MRDALLTFDLRVSAKWLLQETPANQNIRKDRQASLGNLRIRRAVQALQRTGLQITYFGDYAKRATLQRVRSGAP